MPLWIFLVKDFEYSFYRKREKGPLDIDTSTTESFSFPTHSIPRSI